MMRQGLCWLGPISVLVVVSACSSSKSDGVGPIGYSLASAGGQVSAVGGVGAKGGANAATAAGNGGISSNAGGGNATSSGSGDGGNGTSPGGSRSVGGAGYAGGNNVSVGGDGLGGGSSQDVLVTGGTGSSTDVAVGGSGNTVDVATGGGFSIDTATGGGSSIDMATGGGASVDLGSGGGSSVDRATGGGSSVDLGTGGGTSTDYPNCIKTDLNNINVYVITDLNNQGSAVSDSEGSMYVGGNFYSQAGYAIGTRNVVTGDPCSQYSLVVGGNVSGAMVTNGKAVASGTVTNSSNTACGGILRVQKSQLPVDFAALATKFQNLSMALAKLPTSPGATVTRNAGGALVLKGTDPVQNVFNIDGTQLGATTVDVPLSSIVIVNVAGTNISWPGGALTMPGPTGGVNNDYLFSSNVIWNFPQATNFYMDGLAIHGTVLAPFATFECTGAGHIAGQVIVRAMNGLTIEFHPYYFSGCVTWPKAS